MVRQFIGCAGIVCVLLLVGLTGPRDEFYGG